MARSSVACFGLIPEAPKSIAVTLWPACSSKGTTLYQHHAPWQAPWTNTKCICFPSICFSNLDLRGTKDIFS
ncbi:hypothetical protein LINPERHAP2_LOCUS39309 [Linum perenne]